ncbi:MAG: D-alanyl-D-alanine carboxypeptidase/D-alanyl-D-alanine-endopeptidase [Acidobacteriia bacterium]|nr:D-alanyl-D-alanine carboxypeptidase/D-alanyl-D-alanine-endopeptidase [Terriglobia bacterium]
MTGGRVALLALWTIHLSAAPLAQEIARLVDSSPSGERAFWGIQIADLSSGKTLYARNAGRLFVPASNVKLFTLALALSRLGPEYRFQTRVLAEAAPDAEGRVRGGLRLVGGGDPNLSGRAIPYRTGANAGNPLAAIEALAEQVVARGVKRVEGGIVGDDTGYVWEPYPEGWAVDDTPYDYGAPVSALTVNDNSITLTVRPGTRAGDLAELGSNPPLEYYTIDNRVETVGARGARKIHVERQPGSRQVRLWGTIPVRGAGEDVLLAMDDPAEYAALALHRALEERGVTVEGGSRARHRFANENVEPSDDGGVELARLDSARLIEDLRITAKVSQNLHAELALRAVGRGRRNDGSREAGLEEMKTFLGEVGIEEDAYHFNDGSGLARRDLVTPAAILGLLRFMYSSPQREDWIGLLPVGGRDGTLDTRFSTGPAAGRIHAKTGTLAHVSALSGYAERRNGRWVAFSILVNNYSGPAADVRGVMDRICALIVE